MAVLPPIATGFVRKLYRILDQENAAIITWDSDGASFVVADADALENTVLPKYFRGRISAFRQQLKEHGFALEPLQQQRERYSHRFFHRGCPDELSQITHSPLPRKRGPRKRKPKQTPAAEAATAAVVESKQLKTSASRGAHRVTPYPVQHEPEPEFQHAVIRDHVVLAANPLFADDGLGGFVQDLTLDGLSMRCVEPTAALTGGLPGNEEPMSSDVMDALLTLLNNSLSTDGCATGTSTVSVGATVAISRASTTSSSSTGGNNFAEGRPPVVLPQLPPAIVETGQFSDDTLNNLMQWAAP